MKSYFGARRVRGKRGRSAGKKIVVVGILKRGGRVYTQAIPNAKADTLQPILKGHILEDSTVYTDGWRSYDSIIHDSRHYRIYHSHDEFARGKNHINGIESFWSYAKASLAKRKGIQQDKFMLHLKELEWRFNHRNDDKYLQLLKLLREEPL
ncbi:hypothetical protein BH23PAT2_BH23PAT2_05950 [soil metagenome]